MGAWRRLATTLGVLLLAYGAVPPAADLHASPPGTATGTAPGTATGTPGRGEAAAAAEQPVLYTFFGDPRPLVGQAVVMKAAYGPARPGQVVRLERLTGDRATTVAQTTVPPPDGGADAYSSYTYSVRLTHGSPRRADYRFTVLDAGGRTPLLSESTRLQPAPQARGLSSTYRDGLVTPGDRVVVTGELDRATRRTRVLLERQQDRKWRRVTAGRVTLDGRGGSYRLAVRARDDGPALYRVRSLKPNVTAALKQVEVGPPWKPGPFPSEPDDLGEDDPRDYAFFRTPPPRWNPCTSTRYRVNPDGAPENGVADVRAAFERLSEATGVELEYAGRTDTVPGHRTRGDYPTDTQIVVAWVRPGDSDRFPEDEVAAGRGGGVWRSGYRDAAGREELLYYRGFVLLNRDRPLPTGFGGATLGSLVMHEAGHVFGLTHARGPRQVMYDTLHARTPAVWGAGDSTGLRLVGADKGCVYDRDGAVATYPTA